LETNGKKEHHNRNSRIGRTNINKFLGDDTILASFLEKTISHKWTICCDEWAHDYSEN